MIGIVYLLKARNSAICKVGITSFGRLRKRAREIDQSYKRQKMEINFAMPVFFPQAVERFIHKHYRHLKYRAPKGVDGRSEFFKFYWLERKAVQGLIFIDGMIFLGVSGLILFFLIFVVAKYY